MKEEEKDEDDTIENSPLYAYMKVHPQITLDEENRSHTKEEMQMFMKELKSKKKPMSIHLDMAFDDETQQIISSYRSGGMKSGRLENIGNKDKKIK